MKRIILCLAAVLFVVFSACAWNVSSQQEADMDQNATLLYMGQASIRITKQMPELAKKNIDYAFFCCDGIFNMGLEEAAVCAELVGAKHNIPYHMLAQDGVYFDRNRAEQFNAPNRLIIEEGGEIELMSGKQN